ncbi:lysine decarboxylase [Erwinia sp. E_sp_W01_1]|uniref:lysine decarboxylase n=1 Tax=Erwinia sp. E_sp_W01_1 TaxID=3039407 RepID=UPI0030CC3B0F
MPGGSSIMGLNLESTVTGERFDNFFFPRNVIFKSQNLTAKTYNSDASFYITSGTSVANQIAISAICEKNDTVLVDKNCHQSVHFHTQSLGADIRYLHPDLSSDDGEVSAWSYDNLKNEILEKQKTTNGYDLIILTAQSYDGMIYDIPEILYRLLSDGVKTRKFFIDEAWGSLNYFSDDTRKLTVMHADKVVSLFPDIQIICTQSAHKSLYCLRQASLIHCKGDQHLAEKIEIAKYRIHTTSPSYPVLASLEMSRYEMDQYGKELSNYSRKLLNDFALSIENLPELKIKNIRQLFHKKQWHIHIDPTKFMLDVSILGTAAEIKSKLLLKNIYVNRTIGNCLLLNFHIGVNKAATKKLSDALSDLYNENIKCNGSDLKEYNSSDKFIVSYPPGIPLVFPGEVIDKKVRMKINQYREKGMLIIAA